MKKIILVSVLILIVLLFSKLVYRSERITEPVEGYVLKNLYGEKIRCLVGAPILLPKYCVSPCWGNYCFVIKFP